MTKGQQVNNSIWELNTSLLLAYKMLRWWFYSFVKFVILINSDLCPTCKKRVKNAGIGLHRVNHFSKRHSIKPRENRESAFAMMLIKSEYNQNEGAGLHWPTFWLCTFSNTCFAEVYCIEQPPPFLIFDALKAHMIVVRLISLMICWIFTLNDTEVSRPLYR